MDKGFHAAGISIAVAIHGAMVVGMLFAESGCRAEASARPIIEQPRYVEAALAIKGVEEEVSAQPQQPRERQRQEPQPPQPDSQPSVDREPTPERQPVHDPSAEPRPRHPDDDFDPLEVLERNRRLAEADDVVDSPGVHREEVGALAGSEWGTERQARGDPYVGELAGRVKHAWTLPSFERTADLVTWGCVKLEGDGRIVEREIVQPSGSATLDRSVAVALERATDMEEPVPAHLRALLTEQGICFAFRP
jgi:hypothetical protein